MPSESKRTSWIKLMEELDMRQSSHKAWRLLKRLNNDPTRPREHANVTADQITSHLRTANQNTCPRPLRPEMSCTAQVLNLTKHIEDRFPKGFSLSSKERGVDGENKRMVCPRVVCWPQPSSTYILMISPLPVTTTRYIYADDRGIATQGKTFEEVEQRLNEALIELDLLLPKEPTKNQTQPKPKQANRKLQISWRGETLEHCPNPKFLGVTLERTLTYKQHCLNIKMKVSGINNIIRKLTGSTWVAKPKILKASALALCHSTETDIDSVCRSQRTKVEQQPTKYACLPYVSGVTDKLKKTLSKKNIGVRFRTAKKIQQVLPSNKDPVPRLLTKGVYELKCICGKSYIGQTGRSTGIQCRIKEHQRHTRLGNTDKSAIAEHIHTNKNHKIDYENVRVLDKTTTYYPRIIRESLEISVTKNQ
ncbi:hypothetical protein NQ318_009687 [Aromia moschata]|uniref:Reverse transcriptase domain-containing protein n=1 Tax=Aromia moschata TaxID=1265417 RepID=A0AAV8X880_9CUCU|nr:hypothetical protein NQ318_009687 [Aromia moschata]